MERNTDGVIDAYKLAVTRVDIVLALLAPFTMGFTVGHVLGIWFPQFSYGASFAVAVWVGHRWSAILSACMDALFRGRGR